MKLTRGLFEAATGLVVLVVAGFFLVVLTGDEAHQSHGERYEVLARFTTASGISTGSDVRIAGVKVGSVTRLALDPETYLAEVYMALPDNVMLPLDSLVKVASEGLLGGSYIQIDPGGSDEMVTAGGELEFTQGSVDLITLLTSAFLRE